MDFKGYQGSLSDYWRMLEHYRTIGGCLLGVSWLAAFAAIVSGVCLRERVSKWSLIPGIATLILAAAKNVYFFLDDILGVGV